MLKATHEILSWLLFTLAVLHVFAALKHHFWNKDDVLRRMAALHAKGETHVNKAILGCAVALWLPGAAFADAAGYVADPQQSRLEFIGVQAGADFKGVFHKFTGAVNFAPDALSSSSIDVQIDMNSVDSQDKDRDKNHPRP